MAADPAPTGEPRKECRSESSADDDRTAALRRLAYGLSHELNNPLAVISLHAQTLLRDETAPDRRRALAAIAAQAARAHEMIVDLAAFARPLTPRVAALDAATVLRQAVESCASLAEQRRTAVAIAGPERLAGRGDPALLVAAVRALLLNALEAVDAGGWIQARVEDVQAAGQPGVCWSIADDGPGIPEDVRPYAADPFFSGRESGRGLGFGLCRAAAVAAAHGGRLTLGESSRGGALAELWIPTP